MTELSTEPFRREAIPDGLLFQSALRHHRAGELVEAQRLYEAFLERRPLHPDALHLLGLVAHQRGDHAEAERLIRQAIGIAERRGDFWNNLGVVVRTLGRHSEAEAAFRQATEVKSDFAEAWGNLGALLEAQGRLDEAEAACRRAVELDAGAGDAWQALGTIFFRQGRMSDAEQVFRRLAGLRPAALEPWYDLGIVLRRAGRLAEAAAALEHATEVDPRSAPAWNSLGVVLQELGEMKRGADAFRRAAAIDGGQGPALANLASALCAAGEMAEAERTYRRILAGRPRNAPIWTSLGVLLRDEGRIEESEDAFAQALSLRPELAEAHSQLLLTLNYGDRHPVEDVLDAHREWERRHCADLPALAGTPRPLSGRRMRIGYVSPDFAEARFLAPLLAAHDKREFEIVCYLGGRRQSEATGRMRELADHWRPLGDEPPDRSARLVHEDGIDVLVDLAGHHGWSSLALFARRPAPIQVSWLGYPNTTGLSRIDYRLTDALIDPIGEERGYVERLVRLPMGALCYEPPQTAGDPGPPPALDRGAVTFGSLNPIAKLSLESIRVWARILERVPGSRLLLKDRVLADAWMRARIAELFRQNGISGDRLELRARNTQAAPNLALYDEIDVALDPFPYNGMSRTCEALWMGCPVVTLRGRRAAGRLGAAVLAQLGMDALVAEDEGQYVAIATLLATDLAKLRAIRAGLRGRMRSSPLCDGARFARQMETAYRQMWQQAAR